MTQTARGSDGFSRMGVDFAAVGGRLSFVAVRVHDVNVFVAARGALTRNGGKNRVAYPVVDHRRFRCRAHCPRCLSRAQSNGPGDDDAARNRRIHRGRFDCQADLEARAGAEVPSGRFRIVYRRRYRSAVSL